MKSFNFQDLIEFKPEQGEISFEKSRVVLLQAIALVKLKQELIRSLGKDMARGVLTRFGYRCGYHDSKIVKSHYGDEIKFIGLGPIMYHWKGIGRVVIDSELQFGPNSGHYLLKGRWENNHEAEHYIKDYGISKYPVCWISTGYASGFASGFTGQDIICIEKNCLGKGDDNCSWEMRSVGSWGEMANDYVGDFKSEFNFKDLQTMLAEERSIDIHRRMTKLVLWGKGIEAIAQTLHEIVDSNVIIMDKFYNIIATGGSGSFSKDERFLIKKQMQNFYIEKRLKTLWIQDEYRLNMTRINYMAGNGVTQTWIASPIAGGSALWGFVLVHEVKELSEIKIMAMEHACTLCSLELLKQGSALEVELRLKGDVLNDLFFLSGNEKDVTMRAIKLGCDLTRPHRLMIVDLTTKEHQDNEDDVVDIIKSGVGSVVERLFLNSVVGIRGNRILILLGLNESTDKQESVTERVAELVKEWVMQNTGYHSVNITWGRVCLDFTDYKKSFEEAWKAADIMKCLGKKNISMGFEQLGLYGVLWESTNRARLEELALSKLGILKQYDYMHNGNLINTLEQFLINNCNFSETAKAVFIHPNTLKYRLRKIEELAKIDLSTEEDRFHCQFGLRLLKILSL